MLEFTMSHKTYLLILRQVNIIIFWMMENMWFELAVNVDADPWNSKQPIC